MKLSSSLIKIGSRLGLTAALLAPAAVSFAAATAGGPRPVIEVRQTSQDAGVFQEGTVVPFQFEVTNPGQVDLEIAQVKPSCGCTVAKWDRVIKPGARGTIAATMNTLYFRGAVTKHMTVFSNDPARPQLELSITAHLTPLVQISPSPDALVKVTDKPVTQTFTLERSGNLPLKILQVLSYAPYLKAETTPLPGRGRYQLTITALPDAPLGRSNAAVVVWTDMQEGGALTFVITVDRGIIAVPPRVFLGVLPHEMTAPQRSVVTITGNAAPFHVKRVVASDASLMPRLETVRPGAEYRVTVTYTGGWATGRRRQTLTVTTDDPKQPTIEIPVEAIVQAQIANAAPDRPRH